MSATLTTRLVSTILVFCTTLGCLSAQNYQDFKGMTVGVYISGKNFNLDPTFDRKYVQFLKQGQEDRSFAGKLKNEVIIELGKLLEEQLPLATEADSVVFMNAYPSLGKAFQSAYNARSKPDEELEALKELDYIIFLETYELSKRIHKSVFIRSNRMITERIPVEKVNFTVLVFKPSNLALVGAFELCFDRLKDKPVERYFDFYAENSPCGKFLSDCFSAWWLQLAQASDFSCD